MHAVGRVHSIYIYVHAGCAHPDPPLRYVIGRDEVAAEQDAEQDTQPGETLKVAWGVGGGGRCRTCSAREK